MVSVEQGTVIAGKYRLDRALARGGMGSVWVARHLQLEIDVAVKLMAPQYASSQDARVRFEREARASAQLRSPYVVHMYDYGAVADETLFLTMELLQGEDLDARLRRVGRLTPAGLASLVDQVCKALECAHDAGLVHRDLKPANLFMSRQGREEMVKVLDFGIAKAMGAQLVSSSSATKTGTLLGSPHYMSPEQVRRSKEVDPRSDLWSLGVILFQCMTGRVPFAGDELGDVLVAICTDDIPLPSQLSPDLGPEVDRFLLRALTRNPAERFQTARELAEAFASTVTATVVPARGVSDTMLVTGPPAPALPVSVPAVTAPGFAAGGPPPSGTLAPSMATFAAPPGRTRLTVALAALSASVVVLVVTAVLVLRGPETAATADAGPAGVQGNAAPVASALASLAAAVPPAPPSPTTSATTAPPASSAAPARRPAPPVPRSVPSPGASRKQSHDPLDHR